MLLNPVRHETTFFAALIKKPSFGNQHPQVDASQNIATITDLFTPFLDTFQLSKPSLDKIQKAFPTPKSYAFAGDNFGPVDPKFLSILGTALSLQHMTYQKGGDLLQASKKVFQKAFENHPDEPVVTFCLPTGTAAGRLVMTPVLKSVDAIIAADNAHLYNRECSSHFKLNQASVYTIPTTQGKLTAKAFKTFMDEYQQKGHWQYPNNAKPKVLSISQPTEYGAIYSDTEVKALADLAHQHGMLLHMDGSRLFYVAGETGKSLKALTTELGVDMLFIGGSKSKMAMAELAVFTPNFFKNAKGYSRHDTPESLELELKSYAKQYGLNVGQAVGSTAQFAYALESGYATKLTKNACDMAKQLEKRLTSLPHIELATPTETNMVLVKMPSELLKALRQHYELMVFTPDTRKPHEVAVRFMTHAGTTPAEIDTLIHDIQTLSQKTHQG